MKIKILFFIRCETGCFLKKLSNHQQDFVVPQLINVFSLTKNQET